MEDEIKEILEALKRRSERYNYCLKNDISFSDEDYQAYLLLDHITNLQEKNENLKDFNNKLQATKDRLDKYDKENTMLIEDYKSRCEKAIEYNIEIIKDTKGFYRPTEDIIYSGDTLIDIAEQNINILQGNDNNE